MKRQLSLNQSLAVESYKATRRVLTRIARSYDLDVSALIHQPLDFRTLTPSAIRSQESHIEEQTMFEIGCKLEILLRAANLSR